MPSLIVFVDGAPVPLQLEDGDTISHAASFLKDIGYSIDYAYPTVFENGKDVSADLFSKLKWAAAYRFCK